MASAVAARCCWRPVYSSGETKITTSEIGTDNEQGATEGRPKPSPLILEPVVLGRPHPSMLSGLKKMERTQTPIPPPPAFKSDSRHDWAEFNTKLATDWSLRDLLAKTSYGMTEADVVTHYARHAAKSMGSTEKDIALQRVLMIMSPKDVDGEAAVVVIDGVGWLCGVKKSAGGHMRLAIDEDAFFENIEDEALLNSPWWIETGYGPKPVVGKEKTSTEDTVVTEHQASSESQTSASVAEQISSAIENSVVPPEGDNKENHPSSASKSALESYSKHVHMNPTISVQSESSVLTSVNENEKNK